MKSRNVIARLMKITKGLHWYSFKSLRHRKWNGVTSKKRYFSVRYRGTQPKFMKLEDLDLPF